MDAGKQNLLNFLGQNQQLSIPIYQRKYSWTDKECKQLLEDVLRVGNASSNEENHFIGSIVYMNPKGHIAGPISKLLLIDGQQRITTISLLISALYEYLTENPDDTIEDLMNYYLINDKEKGELRYKLILSEEDKDTLIKIINNLTLDEKIPFEKEDSIRVYENYKYFKRNINEENVKLIHQGLSKLLIIFVALEHNIDNPQLIFESLNSTGLELNQADLIRNYILMGLDPEEQERLYKTYWYQIEKLFENKNATIFDKFIRDYLTVKTDKVPTFRNIYIDFKKYSRNFENIETLVKDVFKYANYFKCIAFGEEENFILKKSLDSLSSMGYDVTYPFLLNMYAEYDNGNLSSQDFVEIIKYTESYLFRRLICSIPTPSLNKTFAKMYNDLDKENFLESYKAMLLLKENYHRMPTNKEFKNDFRLKDIYNLRGVKDYLFDKLENWESKEKTQIQSYTIEHIMPQNPNLSQEWINALGPDYEEIQKKYLHTIGNLTLTGYNSEMSDRSFQEKRDMPGGFKQSAIRLNISLQNLDKWDEEEIVKRSKNLIDQSIKLWPYPRVKKEILEKYKPKPKTKKQNKKLKETSYTKYWAQLKQELEKNPMFNNVLSVQDSHYYQLPLENIKFQTAHLTFRRTKSYVKCEIWITEDAELFNYLYESKEEIEKEAELNFNWISEDNRKSKKIEVEYEIDTIDENNWEQSIKWQINIAETLYKVFKYRIENFYIK